MDARELEFDYSGVYRYLDYRRGVPEDGVRYMVEQCMEGPASQTELRSVTRHFPLKFLGDNRFPIGGMGLESWTLSKNMCDCDGAHLMAAIVGLMMDRLVARAAAIGRMSRAVVYQAMGTTLVESYCDALNREFKEEAAVEGEFLRPHSSPGYGDLPFAIQPELLRVLEIQKHTGVTLAESLLMMPTKSVTALIGVSPEDLHCVLQGCGNYSRTSCSFRK